MAVVSSITLRAILFPLDSQPLLPLRVRTTMDTAPMGIIVSLLVHLSQSWKSMGITTQLSGITAVLEMAAPFLMFSTGYRPGELGMAVPTAMEIRPRKITDWWIIMILVAILTTMQFRTLIMYGRVLLEMRTLTDTPTVRAQSMLQVSL